MKPLELVVYRTLEDFGVVFGYDTPEIHATSEADAMAAAKRFTDMELAAEFHAQDVRVRRIENGPHHHVAGPSGYRKLEALHRFATTPHYDEVTA